MSTQANSDVVDLTRWTHERLDWHLRICCDATLRDRAKLLASLLLHDFDLRKGGCAWRGQAGTNSLSERAGWKDPKTAQLAAQELEEAGYIRIERGQGRGKSNRYWPVMGPKDAMPASPAALEKGDVDTPFSDPEKGDADTPFSAEKADADPIKGVRAYALHRKDSSNKHSAAGAREAIFDRLIEACPKAMLRWADQGLVWTWLLGRIDAGEQVEPVIAALILMAAAPEFRSRKHPPQLHDWLVKGMWRGWVADDKDASDAPGTAGAPRIRFAGPEPLRAAVAALPDPTLLGCLERAGWADGVVTPATSWAAKKLAEIRGLIEQHGATLASGGERR